ncbi:hypothetical protein BAE_19460 [Bacillus aerophilus]|nr:hypothetical protein BAE_19460 [Bacillus aerophilus]
MDYSRYLILYSGGADSTYFLSCEPTARFLIYYEGLNKVRTRIAMTNANWLDKYIRIEKSDLLLGPTLDGETNQIHALYDTQMALHASIIAISHGMKGIVMCFNADDIGINSNAVEQIIRRVEPDFRLLLPLKNMHAHEIRANLKKTNLQYVSCLNSQHCGYCPKCIRGY